MKAGNDNGWPHNIQLKAEMLTKTQGKIIEFCDSCGVFLNFMSCKLLMLIICSPAV